jgi:hypothetical protein
MRPSHEARRPCRWAKTPSRRPPSSARAPFRGVQRGPRTAADPERTYQDAMRNAPGFKTQARLLAARLNSDIKGRWEERQHGSAAVLASPPCSSPIFFRERLVAIVRWLTRAPRTEALEGRVSIALRASLAVSAHLIGSTAGKRGRFGPVPLAGGKSNTMGDQSSASNAGVSSSGAPTAAAAILSPFALINICAESLGARRCRTNPVFRAQVKVRRTMRRGARRHYTRA